MFFDWIHDTLTPIGEEGEHRDTLDDGEDAAPVKEAAAAGAPKAAAAAAPRARGRGAKRA